MKTKALSLGFLWLFFSWLSFATLGCGSGNISVNGNAPGSGNGSDQEADPSDMDVPSDSDNTEDSEEGPLVCNEEQLQIKEQVVLPNLMLLVDKSGSMALPTSANNLDRTKLEDTQEAIQRLLLAGEGKIRFGWMEFPEDGGCLPGNVLEPCTDDSIANIQQRVQSLVANGGTPTGESLMNAASYGGLTDEIRSNFVVLLTDGKPSCPYGAGQVENNLEDQELAIQGTKELRMLGVDTFVIGLGEDLNASNPELLNQLAREGGRPRAGAVQYFSANSLGELVEAFDEIQAVIISCTITLSSIPQYPKNLWISLDSEPVNRDPKHQDGFDYDVERNQILFYGSACEKLRSGEVENIQIKMGCAPEI